MAKSSTRWTIQFINAVVRSLLHNRQTLNTSIRTEKVRSVHPYITPRAGLQLFFSWAYTPPVCVFVCWGMMTSLGCSMSLSACASEADVLMGQNWRALLPCVRITRWPLFLGTACQIHPWKMNFQSAVTSYKQDCQMYKREKDSLYPARKSCRAVLNRCAAVSSNWLWNGVRKHFRIIYSASVVGGEEDSGSNSYFMVGVNVTLLSASIAGVTVSVCCFLLFLSAHQSFSMVHFFFRFNDLTT